MMNSADKTFTVCIPTLGRWDVLKQKTLSFLDREGIPMSLVKVYVVAEEKGIYEEHLSQFISSGLKIVVGKRGLPQQRDEIQSHHSDGDWILFLDDDIERLDLANSHRFAKGLTLEQFVKKAFDYCEAHHAYIWSVNPVWNPYWRKGTREVHHMLIYIIGAFYGIINRTEVTHESFQIRENEKEDVRRTLQYWQKDGIVVRFSRIAIETKYYALQGGIAQGMSRQESSKIASHKLLEDFGDKYGYIREKVSSKTTDYRLRRIQSAISVPVDFAENYEISSDSEVERVLICAEMDDGDDTDDDIEGTGLLNYDSDDTIFDEEQSVCNLSSQFNQLSVSNMPSVSPNTQYLLSLPYIPLPLVEAREFDTIYGYMLQLKKLRVQKNRGRGFKPHECAVFGMTFPKFLINGDTRTLRLAAYSIKYPHIHKELIRIGNLICRRLPSDFPFDFNAVHINRNTTCPPHQDAKNMGKSLLVSFGNYMGSRIVIERSLTEAVAYSTCYAPVIFDGSRQWHWNTDDLVGDKYSLVFYTKK